MEKLPVLVLLSILKLDNDEKKKKKTELNLSVKRHDTGTKIIIEF